MGDEDGADQIKLLSGVIQPGRRGRRQSLYVIERSGGSRCVDPVSHTVELATRNVERGGRPFSCVVVSSGSGETIARSPSLVGQTNDPTAHAEVVAIRSACQRLAGGPQGNGEPGRALEAFVRVTREVPEPFPR